MLRHEVYHGDADHRHAALRQGLVVLAQPPILAELAKRSLDNPALGQQLKSPHVIATLHDRSHA